MCWSHLVCTIKLSCQKKTYLYIIKKLIYTFSLISSWRSKFLNLLFYCMWISICCRFKCFMIKITNFPSVCLWPDLDFEELSSSRQRIEERLVEEYRNSSYSSDTRVELDRIVRDKEFVLRPQSHIITYNNSFFHQLRWVLKRTFQNLMLNPQISVAQVYSTST